MRVIGHRGRTWKGSSGSRLQGFIGSGCRCIQGFRTFEVSGFGWSNSLPVFPLFSDDSCCFVFLSRVCLAIGLGPSRCRLIFRHISPCNCKVKELQEELALARRSTPGEASDAAELALMLKAHSYMEKGDQSSWEQYLYMHDAMQQRWCLATLD